MMFRDCIQSARLDLFSDTDGWTLEQGVGERSYWTRVLYDKPFVSAPFVTVCLSGIDASKDSNLRLVMQPHDVTQFGFDLELRTWADSSISYVSVTLMALEVIC